MSIRFELDHLLALDIVQLKRLDYFQGFVSGGVTWTNRASGMKNSINISVDITQEPSFAHLIYTTHLHEEESQDMSYDILLVSTPCNFGGVRWWFICPLVINGARCERRVRVLYKRGAYFGCRACHRLCYSSQNENHHNSYYQFFRVLGFDTQADELYPKIKLKYYNGKQTRNYARYKFLRAKADSWEAFEPFINKALARRDQN